MKKSIYFSIFLNRFAHYPQSNEFPLKTNGKSCTQDYKFDQKVLYNAGSSLNSQLQFPTPTFPNFTSPSQPPPISPSSLAKSKTREIKYVQSNNNSKLSSESGRSYRYMRWCAFSPLKPSSLENEIKAPKSLLVRGEQNPESRDSVRKSQIIPHRAFSIFIMYLCFPRIIF